MPLQFSPKCPQSTIQLSLRCIQQRKVSLLAHQGNNNMSSTDLWALIQSKYNDASISGDLSTIQSELSTKTVNDVTFGFRYVPGLNKKPKAQPESSKPQDKQQTRKPNPFLPHQPGMFITDISSTHKLLLNKFNLVKHHILLVTQQYEQQGDPLNDSDMAALIESMKAFPTGCLAFYNSGPLSGMSQPHKHVQIIPLPIIPNQQHPPIHHNIMNALNVGRNGSDSDDVVQVTEWPYVCYCAPVTDNCSPALLSQKYAKLLSACVDALDKRNNTSDKEYSINWVMSQHWMIMVPRSQECYQGLSINSLGFAGALLAKSPEQLEMLNTTNPFNILAHLGVPCNIVSNK